MQAFSFGTILLLAAALVLSTGVVVVVRRWSHGRLETDSGPVGSIVAIAVTIYSLILGLTVVASYDRFVQAEMTMTEEINALFAVTRIGAGFPDPYREEIHALAIDYARSVAESELVGDSPGTATTSRSRDLIRALYDVHSRIAQDPAVNSAATQPAIGAVMALDDARGQRLMLGDETLPSNLWVVLVVGGIGTVLGIGLVAPQSVSLHLIVAGAAAIIIAMLLNVVADLDRPFSYPIRVDTGTMARAIRTLEEEAREPLPSSAQPVAATPAAP
jgi:hypothetical protein